MQTPSKIFLAKFSAIAAIFFLIFANVPANDSSSRRIHRTQFILGPSEALAKEKGRLPDSPLLRVAARLSQRLIRWQNYSPPLTALVSALEEQRSLLKNAVTINLEAPSNPDYRVWNVSLSTYPSWMRAEISPEEAHFVVSPDAIADFVLNEKIDGIIPPTIARITSVTKDEDGITRAIGTGAAKSGLVFQDFPKVTKVIAQALTDGTPSLAIPLVHEGGRIENASGTDLGELTLLGTGKSDFMNSPSARISNIRKALREHVNNVIVEPGATFSFNETLGGPVTQSRGWREAKVIFNTTELRLAPGGGICQASTTLFRAILNSGFQTVERANHSMYVSYYEKYGVGIDATVFPGLQDLTFVNDSGNPLLIQAYDEGTEATINIFGTPDGRISKLLGPYFASSDLSKFPENEQKPRTNEIVWVHEVTTADGSEQIDVISSRYTAIPRSLPKKYIEIAKSSSGSLLVKN